MSDTESFTSDTDFIDQNNYSFDTASEESDDHSIEIVESEADTQIDEDITERTEPENIGSNELNPTNSQEVIRLQSEHNYDSPKPLTKPSNDAPIQSTQGDNGDNSCIICTEMWTTSGEHQLVSLSCGHLFGRKCIEYWLDPKLKQNQRCPQCNKAAKKKDIRVLYARNLRALDTSERDRALQLLEKERLLRQKAENETIEVSIKLKSVLKENERLKKEYMECQQRIQHLSSTSRITEKAIKNKSLSCSNKNNQLFALIHEIEISPSGNCRLLGYSSLSEVIAVSQPNPNQSLFPGFGVKKVFLKDFKTDFICIHSKAIKDLQVNAYDGTILTASLDKTVKLTSLLSKSVIMSYPLEVDAWSVTFNPNSTHEFFVGLNNGNILLFDNRMMTTHVDQLKCSDSSPVVCLNPIQFNSVIGPISGLLSTQFSNFCLYERNNSSASLSSSEFTTHHMPIEGRFGSAHFEPHLGYGLLSCRPSSKHINTTHYVCLTTG